MRELETPSLNDVPRGASINTLLADRVRTSGALPLIERKSGLGGTWTTVTAQAFADQVRDVAKGLLAHGVGVGDRVAIMSRTRYEWTLLDFAVWAAGAVPVPVYETSSVDQIRWICSDAGVRLVVVETSTHAGLVEEARSTLPDVTGILVIEDDAVAQLRTAGRDVPDDEVARRSDAVGSDDLATIIYTSGTTGRPKGAELTHWNFVHLTRNGVGGLGEVCAVPGARTLLFMPLAHVFARFVEVLCVTSGAVMGHTPDTRNLLPDLASFRPTFLLAVPRVFEKVYGSSEQKAGTGASLRIFRWAAKVSIEMSRATDRSGGPSAALRAQHALAGALVFRKLRTALGGDLRYAISGGAPLGERLGHFYRGVGVTILEGYGLTETTAPTSVNLPDRTRIGSVGLPFPGTTLRIADGGEILVRGDHVFRGYHGNPEATEAAFDDGWFRTGDLGSLDDDGYLHITGRSKEIIVTAGGKNVAPSGLEDRFRGHPLVSQCVVVGDQKPFVAALVTLDPEMLPGWLRSHGLPEMDVAAAAEHPAVLEAMDRAAVRASENVSRAESIRKVRVLTTDFTEANGYLTPSLKVKRATVLTDFSDDIEAIYG
ncbi:AMP-dependent synthetase/ligase [Sanguibacter suaedae]|uniref:Acyl-CoA synthetase n=1 Tax=Sanguibacter suaedae TaxID=2795737 RepID=A0A934M9T9_9MICO|nr:AMP-dependent synthetase/ligase [Sanguibacter suaedae]MBI9115033.1 long-chain fatty acid--CoA ligase [Sanguibacter suaedae]